MSPRTSCMWWGGDRTGGKSADMAVALRPVELDRDRQTLALLTVLWVFSLADLVFTLWAHKFTAAFGELNPVAASLLDRNLIPSVVLLKLVTTAIGATIFWRLRTHAQARWALWAVVAAYVLLLMHWSDYTDLAMAAAPPGM